MLIFLRGLPEPVIPHADIEAFRGPIRTYIRIEKSHRRQEKPLSPIDHDKTLFAYRQLIRRLHPSARDLLLCLLDLLAILISKSAVNGLTSTYLASIFQPVILATQESPAQHEGGPEDMLGGSEDMLWEFLDIEDQLRHNQRVVRCLIDNEHSFFMGEDQNASIS